MGLTIRNNSVTMIVGDSGTGKSSLIATYADYVWQEHGKITCLYTSDGGGYPTGVEALVHKGIIWVFKLRSRGLAFETIARATNGWWPEEVVNPMTGEVAPACNLLPPVQTNYTLSCPKGHPVKTASSKRAFSVAIVCSICKTPTTLNNGTIETQTVRTPGMEQIGGVAYDGLSSMQAWIMLEMGAKTASGELKGEETALGGKVHSGDMVFGGSNRAHYGQAQLRAEDWILDSTAIPGLVAPPLWTALEQRANDRETKLPIYGPKIAGAAKTSDVPSWVGNCLGTRVVVNDDGKKQWRLYLSEYREEDNVPHLCKTRAVPGSMPEFLADDPDDPPFTKFNLGYFFSQLDLALERTLKDADARYKNAPGLPSGRIGVASSSSSSSSTEPTIEALDNKPNIEQAAIKKINVVPSKPKVQAVPPKVVPARKNSPTK